jgi:Cdc6-like AAA superfamily ATPase
MKSIFDLILTKGCMNPKIPFCFLVVGVPGTGKTTICEQLSDQFEYIPHDLHNSNLDYIVYIINRFKNAMKPLLIETPFSVSEIINPLTKAGIKVEPVFIIETPEVTAARYKAREGREIPKGHLTRIETYKQRAKDLNAFQGTSDEVLNYLKGVTNGT